MSSFNEVVRPFSPIQTTPAKPGVLNVPNVVPNVELFIGSAGSGAKVLHGSLDHKTVSYVIKKPKEKDPSGDSNFNPNDDPFNANDAGFNPNDDVFNPNG